MNVAGNNKAPLWMEAAMEEAWKKAQAILKSQSNARKFSDYQTDPVGFCGDVLNDHFTEDIEKVICSVRDNPVTIARSSNAVGKSHCAARVAVWWFACFQDAKVYATSAPPLENLKKILWGQVLGIARNKPTVFTGMRVKSLEIMRHAESFMTGVAIPLTGDAREREAKFSGKHSSHLLFIVDEGDAVPEEVYRGIESCMSGGMARLLVMFNPRDKSGPVYQMEARGQANVVEISALRHPNVLTGEDVIPGAVTRAKVIQRINEWTRPMIAGEIPEEGTFEVPDFLVGETTQAQDGRMYEPLPPGERVVTEAAFWYMVLGKYPEHGVQQLISESWITKARNRYDAYMAMYGETPPVGVKPIMGSDMAEYGGDYNVSAFRYGDFLAPFVFWAGMDITESCDKIVELYEQRRPDAIMADGNGIGASVAPAVMRIARTKGLKDLVIFGPKNSEKPSPLITCDLGDFPILRDQLYWAVREWLKKSNAMLPPDEMLLEELRVVTYTVKGGKVRIMDKEQIRQRLKRSPDRSDALCLTFNPFEKVRWVNAVE